MAKKREENFGLLIQKLRKQKGWTIKQMIEELAKIGSELKTPAYITRIEQYDEIPSPDMICKLAEIFDYDLDEMMACAMDNKLRQLDENLKRKYERAVGLYRTQKKDAH